MNTQAGFFSKNCVRATLIALAALPLFSFANDPLPKEKPAYTFDLSHWKITLPDGSERNAQWLQSGETVAEQFYFNSDGSMVFRSPNVAGTTTNSRYSRSELREMLLGASPKGQTKGVTKNNWVFSTSDPQVKQLAGAVDGTMKATLQVDHVSTTGAPGSVGVVIIGQIHASDDEPLRLHYRKLPHHTRGSIYFAHETPKGKDTWHDVIGSRANNAEDPLDGIALGEKFSYEIIARGLELTVSIYRPGKPEVSKTITMHSGYNNDWMYFKAGVYNQNNKDFTDDQSDYVQATFYSLDVSHP